ncbi:MAG TPA: CinA family nicotinamide mononucleotide deamidase-related protein [Thermodesulfobacteriota bacterium]|nr:CinA family nicotinamide mononucleotide deamidase-related protein [Thermodesulfobacteriota bacterium]
MKAEVIAIGSELLLGQIIDTNSSYIAKRFAENGIELVQTATVGDDLERMKEVIREAIHRSQIVITTGGIGPTEDDLTREAIAEVTQHPLTFQPHLMEQIENLFKRRGFRMAGSNRKQAYIPEEAIPIENPKGTAPGFIVETSTGAIISIPGVPLEMEYLMENTVIPYLRKRFDIKHQVIQYKVLRACGLGESAIGLQIEDLMKESKNPSIGTLASMGDIRIRITAKAENPGEASNLIQNMEKEIRNRLGVLIYGVDNETLHGNIARELERLRLALTVVETFTGGIISQKLTSANSNSFIQGVVLPSEISQRQFLNLSLEEFNSVREDSRRLTGSFAQRARNEFEADLGLAMFGRIAEKQGEGEYRIETYSSLSTSEGIENQEYSLGGELWMVRERASIIALDFLRKYLIKKQFNPKC